MDRRTRISILGLFGFVIMLVGTSKSVGTSGPSPWPDAGTGGEGGGGAGGEGGAEDPGDAGAMSQGDASSKSPLRDGGARLPIEAGAPPATGSKTTSLPPPWDGMALPIGRGQVDALRIVHPASDPRWIEKQYITSLRANGWTAARSEGDIATGLTTELTKAERRLIVRISKKDEDVVVSLNLL